MANNITYADKTYLNENVDVPAINKVRDVDMNEIKSVVNNNASETDTNTQNISNITGTILWTNPNPTSSFSAQNITLNSSDYDMYEVLFYGSTTKADCLTSGRIPKGENVFLCQVYDLGQGQFVRNRSGKYVDDTTLNITEGTQNGSSNNTQNIPVYVIGYKTGLFS